MYVFTRIQQLLFASTCTITQLIYFSIVFVIDKADNVVNYVTTKYAGARQIYMTANANCNALTRGTDLHTRARTSAKAM